MAAAGRDATSRILRTMLPITCFASWANVVTCATAWTCWRRVATTAPTSNTPAPATTTTHAGTTAVPASATAMPTIWKNAPPACESAFPWSRSFPRTSGIAADFTASATRTTPGTRSLDDQRRRGARAPSVESFPSGSSTSPGRRADHGRGQHVGPPHHAAPLEPVDHDADERRDQGVRHVEREDHLEQVVRGGNVLHVEPLLPAERDRLADRALDHALTGLGEELDAHQRGEVDVENCEKSRSKKPPNARSACRIGSAPNRRPAPAPTATATTAHAFVSVSGPRHTASTPIPASSVSTIEVPGINASRLGVSLNLKNGAASSPAGPPGGTAPPGPEPGAEVSRAPVAARRKRRRRGARARPRPRRQRLPSPVSSTYVPGPISIESDRGPERLLLDLRRALAGRNTVAPTVVVLADQEHDRGAG